MTRAFCALGVVAFGLAWAAPTRATVLCQQRSGAVFVRTACKKKEAALDLAQFGAVGPRGDPGPKGDKGDPGGLSVPCETQVGTDVFFTGCNVTIRSGSGSTDGVINGLGNLIVGYNANTGGHPRTGSHNLIVGDEHGYSSYGGLVAGFQNWIAAPRASVSGGQNNTASGLAASVSGGVTNTANEIGASVSGGAGNTAGGGGASVSGGISNWASGGFASVSGGFENTASGDHASVSGGTGLSQPALDGWAAGSATPANTINGDFESP